MPVLFSSSAGRHNPKTLFVDEYVIQLDQGLLSPTTKSLGFKTYVEESEPAPVFISEEEYLAAFREYWPEVSKLLTTVMTTSHRPSVMVNGLPSVSEDAVTSPPTTAISSKRDAIKLNMLRRMRPPPFQYAWTLYHDKHSDSASYEGRLTVMLENIITIKSFWEAYNGFPLGGLKMKDSVHFFKRGVKPVWEDLRNVKGGSWTFRVPKDKSEGVWKEVLLLAVGEQFADVIQPGDDLCGMSLSVRFNSNLVTIWNRDGANQKSIDGIVSVVLDQLSPELKPKEGSYYYKKHSEHAGFNEVIAKAKTVEDEMKAKQAWNDFGKIEEAKVKEDEADQALIEEAEASEEEAEKNKK